MFFGRPQSAFGETQDVTPYYESSGCKAGFGCSCIACSHSSPHPAKAAVAVVEPKSRSVKWIGLKQVLLSGLVFHAGVFHRSIVLCPAEGQWCLLEGKARGPWLSPLLHDSSHGIVLPELSMCWKQSHGLPFTDRRQKTHFPEKCKTMGSLFWIADSEVLPFYWRHHLSTG